jgi:predicted AlkP superfamily phosphohydrolase/phosphomutase
MKEKKIFGIGLDGATFDLLIPWFNEGLLPNLSKIYSDGCSGTLESTTPPLSPQAWTSFMTGKNPGQHGIFDFTEHEPCSYDIRFTNANCRRAKSLWRILSEAGKRVGVINVPMTFPAEKVNGFLISGFDAPGVQSNFVYPPTLYDQIKQNVGEYDLHGDFWTRQGPEQYLERILATIDNQSRAVKYLLKRHSWDFFFVVFGSTDRVQHFYWKYCDPTYPGYSAEEGERFGDAIFRVYEKIDTVVGEYLELIDDNSALMVMSDHGAGPYHKIIFLDQWLNDHRLLCYKDKNKKHPHACLRSLSYGLAREGYLILRKYLPRSVKDWLKSKLPDVRHKIETHLTFTRIDWSKTKAFPWGIEASYIFVNQKGVFPKGIVEPGREYEELRDFIINRLQELRDPETDNKVAQNVYRKEELYHGDCLDRAPDIIIMWADCEYITRQSYGLSNVGEEYKYISSNLRTGEVGRLMALEQTGTHRLNGIFMFSGEPFAGNNDVTGARIIDLAPTILYQMGVPIPEDMDGKILDEIFTKDYLDSNQPVYVVPSASTSQCENMNTYSESESQEVAERLRNLGYLE